MFQRYPPPHTHTHTGRTQDLEGARKARLSGADCLLVKKEMIDAAAAEGKDLRTLLDQVLYVTCGDD